MSDARTINANQPFGTGKNEAWTTFTIKSSDENYRDYVKTRDKVRKVTRQHYKLIENNVSARANLTSKVFWSYVNQRTSTREEIALLEKHCGERAQIDKKTI